MSTGTEDQLRRLLQTGLRDTAPPPRIAERSVASARRVRRRRTASLAVAAILVTTATPIATYLWSRSDDDVQQLAGAASAPPGPGSSDGRLEQVARDYASAQLGLAMTDTLGARRGGECAVYDLLDARGLSHRVVLVLEGEPPTYTPLYISQAFGLQQFVPDSDDACGMNSSGNLQHLDTSGTVIPRGPA